MINNWQYSYEVLVAAAAGAVVLLVVAVAVVAAPSKLNPTLVVAGAAETGATRGVQVMGATWAAVGLAAEVVAAPNESPDIKRKNRIHQTNRR